MCRKMLEYQCQNIHQTENTTGWHSDQKHKTNNQKSEKKKKMKWEQVRQISKSLKIPTLKK